MKRALLRLLRETHTLELVDEVRLLAALARTFPKNREFRRNHPDFALPPARISYDAYGHTRADSYYQSGLELAQAISDLIQRYRSPNSDSRGNILDWGCGAGRVIRHLADYQPDYGLYGADYNHRTIEWCQKNIPGVTFVANELDPPMPFSAEMFDCIYALSVFTHLSEPSHFAWREELLRLLAPHGLLIITTHGDSYRDIYLSDPEKELFDAGRLVVHGGVREGKKWFTAFQSTRFVEDELSRGFEILDHFDHQLTKHSRLRDAGGPKRHQETWILRKAD